MNLNGILIDDAFLFERQDKGDISMQLILRGGSVSDGSLPTAQFVVEYNQGTIGCFLLFCSSLQIDIKDIGVRFAYCYAEGIIGQFYISFTAAVWNQLGRSEIDRQQQGRVIIIDQKAISRDSGEISIVSEMEIMDSPVVDLYGKIERHIIDTL